MSAISTTHRPRARTQAAGAAAFVAKGGTIDKLIAIIRQVAGRSGRSRDVP